MTLLEVLVTHLLPRRTHAGEIALVLPMSVVRKSGRNNLFAHGNQKVFLSCCNKYCKLHALVETGLSPSLGKSFEWQHGPKKKKNQPQKTLGASSQICCSDRPMYQQLPVDFSTYQILVSINKGCEQL